MTSHTQTVVAAVVALGVLLTSGSAQSQAQTQDAHRQTAQALHKAISSADAKTSIQLVAAAMGAQDPMLRKHRAIVEGWLADQIASPAYAEAKVAAYMQVYTAEELAQILSMVKTPAFKTYQEKHQQTLRLSAPRLSQLARENEPELERRIQAAERSAR